MPDSDHLFAMFVRSPKRRLQQGLALSDQTLSQGHLQNEKEDLKHLLCRVKGRFQGSSHQCNKPCSSSSGLVQWKGSFKALFFYCNKLFISYSGVVQRKGFLSRLSSLQCYKPSSAFYRSPERFFFKALFSSMQQALVSCSGSFSGKAFHSRLYPIGVVQRKDCFFQGFFPSMQQALVSCSGSFSGKVFLSRLSSLQCNKPSPAAVDLFSGKVS